jgi:hypothetical protein
MASGACPWARAMPFSTQEALELARNGGQPIQEADLDAQPAYDTSRLPWPPSNGQYDGWEVGIHVDCECAQGCHAVFTRFSTPKLDQAAQVAR